MKYIDIINDFKNVSLNKGFSFFSKDVYQINFKETSYSVINLFIESVEVYENTQVYNMVIYYIDRLTEDRSNEIQVQSDGILYLMEILNSVDTVLNYPFNMTPFTESFADNCAGVFCRFNITTKNNIGVCEEY